MKLLVYIIAFFLTLMTLLVAYSLVQLVKILIKAGIAKRDMRLCEKAIQVFIETDGNIDAVLALKLPEELRRHLEEAKEEMSIEEPFSEFM